MDYKRGGVSGELVGVGPQVEVGVGLQVDYKRGGVSGELIGVGPQVEGRGFW